MKVKDTHVLDRAANSVLSAVTTGVQTYGTKSVTTVGHSLGAAISLLDAIYLPLHISGLTVTFYGYGLPRVRIETRMSNREAWKSNVSFAQVGNQAFANYVDSQLNGRFTRITNLKDPVPILPGQFLGFKHPSGEDHIDTGEVWKLCPGQENPSTQCSDGAVPNIFVGDIGNHDGPYNGITMGC